MKIATFNVEFLFDEGEYKHSGKMWLYTKEYVEARITHLAKKFLEIDADILFLQELASENVLRKIIEKTGKNYLYYIATPDKFGVGNAVIYKGIDCSCESIEATSHFPVFVEGDQDTISPRVYSRRAFIRLTTLYRNKPLHLLGLHLNSRFFVHMKNKSMIPIEASSQIEAADSLIRSEVFRFMQARKMRQVVDELFKNDKEVQVAVMGDFNSIEGDTTFRIIQGEFNTHPDALVSTELGTPIEKRYSFIGENGKKLIDYILLSKSLTPHMKSFHILNDSLGHHNNQLPSPTFVESDHAPLVIELA